MNENTNNPPTTESVKPVGLTPEIVPVPGAVVKNRSKDGIKEYNFKPGQSGNPSGKPKQTKEQKKWLKLIRGLTPKAYAAMIQILDNPRAQAMAKVRVIELILSYTLGKPENTVNLNVNMNEQVIASELRVAALVQSIQINNPSDPPSVMENNYTPEQMERMGLIFPDEEASEDGNDDLDVQIPSNPALVPLPAELEEDPTVYEAEIAKDDDF